MATLLLVDDEPNVLYSLELSLAAEALDIVTAQSGKDALRRLRRGAIDAVILDVRLPDMSGLDVFDRIRAEDPRLPVIIMTAHGTTETAIEAMKRGAFDYLLKPVDLHQLQDIVGRALDLRRMQSPALFDTLEGEPVSPAETDRIVGQSPSMQEVYKAIGRVAAQEVNVLVTGESGTGKELVARAIYQHSNRADKPFLAINCAAIPEGLLESELFGHEKGAFTGADRKRIGKFEQANGGTIFLDEIGDMAPPTQAKMLRLLQEQQFERLGSGETVTVDVRVLAATNRTLQDMIVAGTFREDLYYRLNGFTVHLPPLRERKDDLPLLVDHFLKMLSPKLGKPAVMVAPEAMRLIENYAWPGNIRELQNAIRFAVVQSVGEVVTPECLPRAVFGVAETQAPGPAAQFDLVAFVDDLLRNGENEIYRKIMQSVDRVVLEAVLRHANGSQVVASELLGMSRTTLRAKLQALGMTVEKQIRPEQGLKGKP
ncbi:MAG TPA: sigma-54 dependent transcriptional regulator [Urbifossiella sp.]|nr:sigma-54 dependent transcriptional regulator [Urbifossiella sp.]